MASSIVESAAKQSRTLLVEEARYLYAVSEKIKELQSELERMHCFFEDADNRQHQEKVVRKWVPEIRDFMYEAEDLIERYVPAVSRPRCGGIINTARWFSCVASEALTLLDIVFKLDSLNSRIIRLVSRLNTYGVQIIKQHESSTTSYIAKREQRRTYSRIQEKTVGLETRIKELLDKLVEENRARVVGRGGSTLPPRKCFFFFF